MFSQPRASGIFVCSNHKFSVHRVRAAQGPGIGGGILGVVAQVGDPGTVAVARREVDAVRGGQHLFQVALTVCHSLPQVQIDAALAGCHLGQLLVHPPQHIGGKARLFCCHSGPHRRDGLHLFST